MGTGSVEPARRVCSFAAAIALAVLLSIAFVLTGGGRDAAVADVEDFTFESMDVVYELGRADDGTSTLRVTETFVAVFPEFDQNRGMRRSIPDSYLGAPLNPALVSITDADGRARASETASEDGYFSMTSRADDFVHGRQTYVFTYTLENVARYFADTGRDEFYWDVNGTEWRQPFGAVSVELVVDDSVAGALTGDQACYVGYQGAEATCPITADGSTFTASTTTVGPYETLTIAVGFERGTFAEFDPSFFASSWGWLQAVAAAMLAGTIVFAGVTRARKLRDEPGRPTIIAEYTPPPIIDALESAVLLGKTTKGIPAEVLEQAVVGSIRIEEGARRWFSGTKLKAVLIDSSKADGDGRMLLRGLFPYGAPGEEFEFGRTDRSFSAAAQHILKAAERELKNRGLRREVTVSTRVLPAALAVIAAAFVMLFGFVALDAFVAPLVPIVLILAAAVGVFVVIGLVARKPLTALGAETRDHLAGLKIFIEWAEADRIRMLQSPTGAERVPVDVNDPTQKLKLYETLLPYAVVFGQEKAWAKELAVLYAGGTPGWYYGTHGFDAGSFSSGISSLSASAASSSSTSGGSGGGGSAGGGGGGGGGGGV